MLQQHLLFTVLKRTKLFQVFMETINVATALTVYGMRRRV